MLIFRFKAPIGYKSTEDVSQGEFGCAKRFARVILDNAIEREHYLQHGQMSDDLLGILDTAQG